MDAGRAIPSSREDRFAVPSSCGVSGTPTWTGIDIVVAAGSLDSRQAPPCVGSSVRKVSSGILGWVNNPTPYQK